MFYWPVSLVSHFRWLAYRKRTRSGGRTVLPAIPGARCFDVVRIIDARRPAMFVLENVKT